MTHKDIYTKFMIEYDKANVTSSYPSLTEYEVKTILDKAYLALIAQKFTGNNIRKASFESDLKSISDLEPLINRESVTFTIGTNLPASNAKQAKLPNGFMYFVQLVLKQDTISMPTELVSHNTAEKFFQTPYNKPWIKIPVCYVEGSYVVLLYDSDDNDVPSGGVLYYIKEPNKFINGTDNQSFELQDTMAEELISLAVSFALENVESQRLNSNLSMRRLES